MDDETDKTCGAWETDSIAPRFKYSFQCLRILHHEFCGYSTKDKIVCLKTKINNALSWIVILNYKENQEKVTL